MNSRSTVELARTLLFVPGDRGDRFAKAFASDADLVILDLEDAVPAGNKSAARRQVADWLAGNGAGRCVVRVNAVDTEEHIDDVRMVAAAGCAVMLPKCEHVDVLVRLMGELPAGTPVIGLVETASGVLEAARIARATGITRLAFGNFDLAAQIGVSPDDRDALAPTRALVVLASAAAGLPAPIDGVTGAVNDETTVRDDALEARRCGFGAKLCIHPAQVRVAERALRPTREELAWAEKILASARDHVGVAVVDGRMVDRPVVDRARRIVSSGGEPGPRENPTRPT